MIEERHQQICDLFHAALLRDRNERASFLEESCAGDEGLRLEVQALLEADEEPAQFFEKPVIVNSPFSQGKGSQPGGIPDAIGKYQVIRLLGEGGMGAVYEARQEQPRRAVALKVIKYGLANRSLFRRFEQEAEALARLQHPGIAQVYEVGTADAGYEPQPYFAMELIRGPALVDYANEKNLNPRQRLELLARVCDAVHHAHQRGIIHRDLKPGNILVDETGQPKILDFGVARATDCDTHATRQTLVGQLIGTLAYMSPEQVIGDPLELDIRTDVYALGVLLYELLAGHLPYKTDGMLHDALQAIREEDPAPLGSINRAYRGDVETIVAKSLEKDKTRRYASAAELAGDIRRYWNDEPIMARPSSAGYQFRKFARRNKMLVSSSAAVFVVLVAGIAGSAWQAIRATRAQQIAIAEKQRADHEAATVKAVNDFLQNDLLAQAGASTQARPGKKPDADLKVRTALDRAAAGITGKFDKQPLVEASIRQTIAHTFNDLGLYSEAQQQIERALNLHRRVLGEQHPETLQDIHELAQVYLYQGKYEPAEQLYSKSFETLRRLRGEEHPDTLSSMSGLAVAYRSQGKYEQTEQLLNKIIDVSRRVLGEEHSDTLTNMNNLAVAYLSQGKYAQASSLITKVVESDRRVLGEEHPNTLIRMNNLAGIYLKQGKYGQADQLYNKVLEVRIRILGVEHSDTLITMSGVGRVHQLQGQYSEAEKLFSKVLTLQRRVLGEEHSDTLTSSQDLASVLLSQGKQEQAAQLLSKALSIQRRVLGESHPSTLKSMNSLAVVYVDQGKFGQAEQLYATALNVSRRVLGEEHPDTVAVMANLATLYLSQAKYDQSQPLFQKVLQIQRRVLGEEHPATLVVISNMAFLCQSQGKYEQAEQLYDTALRVSNRVLGPQHMNTMSIMASVGEVRLLQEKYAAAEPPLRVSLRSMDDTNQDNWRRYSRQNLLGASLAGQKKYAEAEHLLVSGYQGMIQREATIPRERRPYLEKAAERIVTLYERWEKPDKAAEWREKLNLNRGDRKP